MLKRRWLRQVMKPCAADEIIPANQAVEQKAPAVLSGISSAIYPAFHKSAREWVFRAPLNREIVKFFTKFLHRKKCFANIPTDESKAANYLGGLSVSENDGEYFCLRQPCR